jgi:hypothetical protein
MKIVTIPIKVEVPDNAKQVAVDENGEVWSACSVPLFPDGFDDYGLGIWCTVDGHGVTRCRILNWRETLTKVKQCL